MPQGIDFQLLEAVRSRLTLSTTTVLGSKLGLPKANTWHRFEEALIEAVKIDPLRAAAVNAALEKLLQNTICAGDRAITLFRVAPARASAISAALSNSQVPLSPYSASYPNPLPQAALKPLGDELFLSELRPTSGGVTAIFSGRRLIEDREERSAQFVDQAALTKIGWADVDEFVLVTRRYVQTYEVVHVDTKTGLIELRVEEHQGVRASESLLQLQAALNAMLIAAALTPLNGPVNLFPAIKGLYDDTTEGIVVELGFTTLTGSAKHEKMRAHMKDLRVELFHVGGKKAVSGHLSPFRVAVRWQAPSGVFEELMLPGSMRQLAKGAGATLEHALLLGTLNEASVRRCVKRLEKHV